MAKIELYKTTRGFEEDAALRKELETEQGYKLHAVFEKPTDAQSAAKELPSQDVKFVRHISTTGISTWEIYSKAKPITPEVKQEEKIVNDVTLVKIGEGWFTKEGLRGVALELVGKPQPDILTKLISKSDSPEALIKQIQGLPKEDGRKIMEWLQSNQSVGIISSKDGFGWFYAAGKVWEKSAGKVATKPAVVKGISPMQPVEELEQELFETEAETEALAETVAGSRVKDLTELVSKGGKMRGHLTGLTPKQYRKYMGKEPPPDLLTKAKDATTRKVQWDMVLDQLASERGFKGDEELRDAIERTHSDIQALEKAKSTQRTIRTLIIEKLKAEPEVKTIVLDDACPQFPDSTCAAEVTMVNGIEFRLRRQHSYWRMDAGDKSFRIRYAKDARKMASKATAIYKADIRKSRIAESRKRLPGRRIPLSERLLDIPRRQAARITEKRPRLG